MTRERVDVCICTFRRPGVAATIASIAAQDVGDAIELRIVVADNDTTPSAAALVEEAARRGGVGLRYVHAPARNISIARNACLDASGTRWIAFIDDDEVAAPGWLATLLAARGDVEIVFGRSAALFGDTPAPRWMRDGGFHDNAIGRRDGALNGYTCNVLLDRDFVRRHAVRFRAALGRTGGEDTVFFAELGRVGARARYVADALVREAIPARRATLRWLAARRFRSGQVHCLVRRGGGGAARGLPAALAKIAYCYALALATLPARRVSVAAFLRGTLHLGFVAALLGARTYVEYGDRRGE